MNHIKFAFLLLAASQLNNAANAADVKVDIKNIKQLKGEIVLSLTSKPEAFLAGPATKLTVKVQASSATAVFTNVAPGEYAISLFQDLNGNQKLDRNFMGIPSEPYGASNNAKGSFGPPKYTDAKFVVGTEEVSLSINLLE